MNTVLALQIIEASIILATNALLSAQRYNALVIAAREAGRDITDEELAALQAESQSAFNALEESLYGTEISTD